MKREPNATGMGVATFLIAALLAAAPAAAQVVTGTLGDANATTTINGNQIPAPERKFGGVIKQDVKNSKTWWPPLKAD